MTVYVLPLSTTTSLLELWFCRVIIIIFHKKYFWCCGIALSFCSNVWQAYWIMQFHANPKTVLLPCTVLANINWTRILMTETTQSKPERTPYAQKIVISFSKEEKACIDEYTNNIHTDESTQINCTRTSFQWFPSLSLQTIPS